MTAWGKARVTGFGWVITVEAGPGGFLLDLSRDDDSSTPDGDLPFGFHHPDSGGATP